MKSIADGSRIGVQSLEGTEILCTLAIHHQYKITSKRLPLSFIEHVCSVKFCPEGLILQTQQHNYNETQKYRAISRLLGLRKEQSRGCSPSLDRWAGYMPARVCVQ